MTEPVGTPNLPAQISDAIVGIPRGLVPAAVKALDRLIGAAVDIPVAWLGQKRARIEAQTETYKLVEASIAKAAASEAGADQATVQRAVDVLVRKAYRRQTNREAVAVAMIEDLSQSEPSGTPKAVTPPIGDVDDDWLNVFERYAEDASSERMQKLWGRVLAGEVRCPGRFSPRTLRFLSEFSQADALTFERVGRSAFGDSVPKQLVAPDANKDIRDLVYLEANGLIQGASGLGLRWQFTFNQDGLAFIREGNLVVVFKGEPNASFSDQIIALTPLGQELVSLLPARDARAAARAVALAMRTPQLVEAHLATLGPEGALVPLEVFWLKENPETASSQE